MSESPEKANPAAFPVTRWTLIASSRGEGTRARRALDVICATYWYPVYAFARAMGLSPPDAEDATQVLFGKLAAGKVIANAEPAKGRLRSYLIATLKNIVKQEWRRSATAKRGGGVPILSIDQEEAEGRYLADASQSERPDEAFERRWALTVLDAAMSRLRRDYAARDDEATFEALAPLLIDAERGQSFRQAASRLKTSEGAVRVALFRLRKRYRQVVREEVAETVSDPSEIEDEIAALLAALSR